MEIIRNYIENCFLPYEQTPRVLEAKAELLSAMEDKFNDLIAEGKTENEAIGTVIAEFGDISELKNELGLTKASKNDFRRTDDDDYDDDDDDEPEEEKPPLVIYKEDAKKYIKACKRMGRGIGFGVFMCINCVSALLFVNYLRHYEIVALPNIGVAALLFFVAIAVAVIVFSALTFERYEKYEDFCLQLDQNARDYVEEKQRGSKPWFAVRMALGIALCILSPASYFIFSDLQYIPTVVLLLAIGLGVGFMSSAGISSDAYSKLLEEKDNTDIVIRVDIPNTPVPENTEKKAAHKNKLIRQVCNSGLWAVTLLVFFVWGFVFDGWSICWIVFIVSSLISAILNPLLGIIEK